VRVGVREGEEEPPPPPRGCPGEVEGELEGVEGGRLGVERGVFSPLGVGVLERDCVREEGGVKAEDFE